MMRTWRLMLVGFGTVGRGVAERLRDAREELAALGCDARLVAVLDPLVGSVQQAGGLDPDTLVTLADGGKPLSSHPGATSAASTPEVIADLGADIVIEVTPTNLEDGEPGLSHVRAALAASRHVITTNKGPIALAYRQLQQLAAEHRVALRFEGTVLSGTPVISLCDSGLAAAGIRSVRGILNGTCNFILTEMESGCSYAEALAAAQQAGYAETDPTGDVEGWDAAAKLVILANSVLGAEIELNDVECTGISSISSEEVAAARAAGKSWRLVGSVVRVGGAWRARVEPQSLDADDPLAAVSGADNLLVFDTEALGSVRIGGPGAGRRATGHAVCADLIAIHRRFGAPR
ncbi:MAG: homoserine dehydrogenase [Acidobacteriota bacterium]